MVKLGKPKVLLFLSLHYWIKKKSRHQVLRLVCNHRGIKYRIEIKNLERERENQKSKKKIRVNNLFQSKLGKSFDSCSSS